MIELSACKAIVRGLRDGRLTTADCRLLAAVRLLQALASVAVAWGSVPAARRILSGIRPSSHFICGFASERQIIRALEASARLHGNRRSCLARALTAELLLESTPVTVVIGVRPSTGGRLESHAWVEREGSVLIGGHDSPVEYTRMIAWSSGPA